MAKKKKRKQITPAKYAARLARAGMASVDLLDQYEEQVRADPDRWATPHGATEEEMLAGVALLRVMVLMDTMSAQRAA